MRRFRKPIIYAIHDPSQKAYHRYLSKIRFARSTIHDVDFVLDCSSEMFQIRSGYFVRVDRDDETLKNEKVFTWDNVVQTSNQAAINERRTV